MVRKALSKASFDFVVGSRYVALMPFVDKGIAKLVLTTDPCETGNDLSQDIKVKADANGVD